jgi:hypothetical protein
VAYDPDTHRPFTLWLETLPGNDTARLLIWPRSGHVQVELYWNRELHSERRFPTREAAEAWGYELHRVVLRDTLVGALLGYDREVFTQLTDAVPLTLAR